MVFYATFNNISVISLPRKAIVELMHKVDTLFPNNGQPKTSPNNS
jgi:hypothetical protein